MDIVQKTSHSLDADLMKYNLDEASKDNFTIVIPTLNEELAIGPVIDGILLEGFTNILVVDGNSGDRTAEIAMGYGVPVIQQHGSGKTGAIKTAIEHVKTPYIIVMDGDFTYDPRDIERFLPHVTHYNEIIGVRQLGRENITRFNRIGNWVINKTFNLLFGTTLGDICSGMYSLKTDFARDLKLSTGGFDVEVEIAAQAAVNYSITEISINYGKRMGERKLHPVRDGIKIFSTVWRLARIYNPILLYSAIATLTIFPALAILAWSVMMGFLGSWSEGFALFGVLLMLFGIQFMSLGIISMQQRRMEQRIIYKLRDTKEN